jgi:peptide/nickel transport system permease protein
VLLLKRLRRGNRAFLIGALCLAPFLIVALIPQMFAPYQPNVTLMAPYAPPSAAHPLGTDELGRDILSRVLYAARADLGVSLASTAIALVIGATVGLVSGYLGGMLDVAVQRCTDIMLSFPSILLALFLIIVLGRGTGVEILSLAILYIPGLLRLSRGLALSARQRGYVEASVVSGARTAHITRVHLLPSAAGPLLVGTALVAANALLLAATLSYLGLGTQLPDPSWGSMLQESFDAIFEAPWFGIVPGLCITVVALGYTWLGEGIDEALGLSGQRRGGKRVTIAATPATASLPAVSPAGETAETRGSREA